MKMPGGAHEGENIGDTYIKIYFLEDYFQHASENEDKIDGIWGFTPDEHIPCYEKDPDTYKVLCQDSEWMVVKMKMSPGEEDKPHSHREHVVIILEGGQLSIWGGKEKTDPENPDMKADVVPGLVLPVPTGWHIVANTGDTEIHAIFFERVRS